MMASLNPWLIAVVLNTVLLGIVGFAPKKLLTVAGVIHAWILGVIVWGTLGWQGYTVVTFYFWVGSGVTRIGMAQKEAEGIAEKRSGARGPENVWGSALTATVCAIAFWSLACQSYLQNILTHFLPVCASAGLIPLTSHASSSLLGLLLLGYVASFSTKLADTCASEVGKAYGKRTFLITTLQPVARGTEGAVSLEGTLAGIIASIAIAGVGWGVSLMDFRGVMICAIAAFVGTNLESVIGATLQSKFSWLTNEVVNIFNTAIGASVAIALGLIWP